jgi:tetratricopeptide (TPR) repeat protein
MTWKDRLLGAFRRPAEQEESWEEAETLKAIQRETGENFSLASERYREYVQANPSTRLGRNYLAGTLRLSGRWDEALETLRDLLQLQNAVPNTPDALTTRLSIGQVLYDRGEFDAAISEFENLLSESSPAIRPLRGIIYLSLGTVYFAKGQRKEAHDAWKRAIKSDKSGEVAERAKELLKRE